MSSAADADDTDTEVTRDDVARSGGDERGRDIFGHIYGQQRAKVALRGALRDGDVDVLLVGPPGSGKSEFLKALERDLPQVRYLDGDAISQSEMKDVFAEDHAIICFDEFDELDYDAYRALSTPLEDGRVIKDTSRQSYDVQIDTQVIAACNETDRIPGHIMSRFNDVDLEPYSKSEFRDVCKHMLPREVDWVETEAHAVTVADKVLEIEDTTDPRVARNLARMANGPDELDEVAAAMDDPNAEVADVGVTVDDVARTKGAVERERMVDLLACETVTPGECGVGDGENGHDSRDAVREEVGDDIDKAIEEEIADEAIEDAAES